ncbi:hypothetical protein V6N13_073990 [Hibiscus sabdariffa]
MLAHEHVHFKPAMLLHAPRPFSRTDLMKALVTSRKTGVVANEYSRLSSQLSGQWRQREPDDCQVATA